MKKVVIYANCQSVALSKTLNENEEFLKKYVLIDILPVHNIESKEELEFLIFSVKEADVFIYQHVNDLSFAVENRTEYLLRLLKPEALKISFPSLYFDGYFPHLYTMEGLVGPLNTVHDYIIAYCFYKGFTEEKVIELINDPDLYSLELSKSYVTKSIESLAKREKENNIDIVISPFIKENYKKQKLFNQFNHPKRAVFEELVKIVLQKLNIENKYLPLSVGYLDGIETPIYLSMFKNLDLEFSEKSTEYSAAENGKLTQSDIVHKFYECYKKVDKKQLLKIIKRNKSFVINLIESY